MTTQFQDQRRQQFLDLHTYEEVLRIRKETSEYFAVHPVGSGKDENHRHLLARLSVGRDLLELLLIRYTAGETIEPLRADLEKVVFAYERYGELLWKQSVDRNEFVFDLQSIDEYCQLMQLIGLSFLLHRRDLLPRIAALQDGHEGANGGADNLYEEFMSHGLGANTRYESDWISAAKPYQALSDALYSPGNDEALKNIHAFLKCWYKDLAGTGWHDSHKPNESGNVGGYYGYWSFEAGAAVLLLGIEDDSSLHKYLYYPKDLVAWAREHAALSASGHEQGLRLRCEAGQACPREGQWETPAQADSRRHFKQGEVMPSLNSDYGLTIWQWVGA